MLELGYAKTMCIVYDVPDLSQNHYIIFASIAKPIDTSNIRALARIFVSIKTLSS